jgi:acyl dehydratase
VHCFAAIYAPTEFETRIAHRWQRYVPSREAWVNTDRIAYRVVGGRRTGYRGVTFKRHVQPGQWRVSVETAAGRPIGRIRFEVVAADTVRDPTFTTHRYE